MRFSKLFVKQRRTTLNSNSGTTQFASVQIRG
jgi:hypothetical protein